jgi:hypothetical protein
MIDIEDDIITPAGGAVLVGSAPSVLVSGIPVGSASLALAGIAPTIDISKIFRPGTGSLDALGQGPAQNQGVFTQTGSLTLAGAAPRNDLAITPPAGALSLVGVAPAINRVVPGRGTVTITGRIPVVSFETRLTPATGSLTLVGKTPTIKNPNWTPINDNQTAKWTNVNNAQTANWVAVAA